MTNAPEVTLDTGIARGFWRTGLDSRSPRAASAAFLGIPFAEPPIDDLRFATPVPRRAWSGVLDATNYGPTAQIRPLADVTAIPEPSIPGDDILTVNVFTPSPGQPEAGLPVLVWIHGGGYQGGSPASPWYDGFAFNTDGVVTLTLGYRLGFDGFGVIDGAPTNRGLLDQIEALRWVQRNIAAFGGDPRRVTIAGQSAGGGSVLALVASPLAQGLFAGAISQSGALPHLSMEQAAERTRGLADVLDIPPTLAGFRSVDPSRIYEGTQTLEASGALTGPPDPGANVVDGLVHDLALAFVPVGDDVVLPADWVTAVGESPVPLLMGTTAHEFTAAGAHFAPVIDADAVPDLFRASSLGDVADDVILAYPDFPGTALLGQFMTDTTFRVWVPIVARVRKHPLYAYDFRWVNATDGLASHCAELPFVWHHLSDPKVATSSGPDAPVSLADAMHGVWVEFIASHAVGWGTWAVDHPRTMVFDAAPHEADDYVLELAIAEQLALN